MGSSGRTRRRKGSAESTRPAVSRTAAISTIRAFAGSRLVVSLSMTTASNAMRGVALPTTAIRFAPPACGVVTHQAPWRCSIAAKAGASMRLLNSSWILHSVTLR